MTGASDRNYNLLREVFPRKDFRVVPYHTLWLLRAVAVEKLKRPEFNYTHLIFPYKTILVIANLYLQKRMPLKDRLGRIKIRAVTKELFYGHPSWKRYRRTAELGQIGFKFIGELLQTQYEPKVRIEFYDRGIVELTLFDGSCELLQKMCLPQKRPKEDIVQTGMAEALTSFISLGQFRVPISIYDRRRPVLIPLVIWSKVRSLADILAACYINTRYINKKYSTIPYNILKQSLLDYFPRGSSYYKNKRRVIDLMNDFCERVGLPPLFQYKDKGVVKRVVVVEKA